MFPRSHAHKLVVAIIGAACAFSIVSCVPMARNVAGHPGLVRSPYTCWPRLVDVQGALPGTVIDCPYTHHPFMVSTEYVYPYPYGSSTPVVVETEYRGK
jgi:hypothetical protein